MQASSFACCRLLFLPHLGQHSIQLQDRRNSEGEIGNGACSGWDNNRTIGKQTAQYEERAEARLQILKLCNGVDWITVIEDKHSGLPERIVTWCRVWKRGRTAADKIERPPLIWRWRVKGGGAWRGKSNSIQQHVACDGATVGLENSNTDDEVALTKGLSEWVEEGGLPHACAIDVPWLPLLNALFCGAGECAERVASSFRCGRQRGQQLASGGRRPRQSYCSVWFQRALRCRNASPTFRSQAEVCVPTDRTGRNAKKSKQARGPASGKELGTATPRQGRGRFVPE